MNLLKDLRNLFMPNRCLHCTSIIPPNAIFLCVDCSIQLEHTSFFNYKDNPVEKLFWGKVKVEEAAALYYYQKKSPIQSLLKELKYNGLEKFGMHAAKTIALELEKTLRFKHIDLIIPVPLHPKKEKKRGYNQVHLFGTTLAEHLGIPYLKDGLIRVENTKSQTVQNKEERYKSVKFLFKANTKHNLNNKNILIVDDVLTTGATLISCCHAIYNIHNANISIITIACVV